MSRVWTGVGFGIVWENIKENPINSNNISCFTFKLIKTPAFIASVIQPRPLMGSVIMPSLPFPRHSHELGILLQNEKRDIGR